MSVGNELKGTVKDDSIFLGCVARLVIRLPVERESTKEGNMEVGIIMKLILARLT